MCTCLRSCRNNSLFQPVQSSEEPGENVMGKVRKYLQKTVCKMKGRTSLLTCMKYITWRRNAQLCYLAALPKGFASPGWKRGLKQLWKIKHSVEEQLPYKQSTAGETQLGELRGRLRSWYPLLLHAGLYCWRRESQQAGWILLPPSAEHSSLCSLPKQRSANVEGTALLFN